MKKKMLEYALRVLLYGSAAFGWWGLLYPQLAMTADTVAVVYEEDAEISAKTAVQADANMIEWDFDSDLYWKVLQAEPEQIRLKSGLLRLLREGR